VKFVDEAIITVQSGNGGNGCVSFRREKFVPRGGPDGGDGGKGGDVILKASGRLRTLHHFRYRNLFRASRGAHGKGKNKTGRRGRDLVVEVPPGTLVTDAETGQLIRDLTQPGESVTVARGGRGGWGNVHFKTSTRQAPRFAHPGEAGTQRKLKLDLKLLADVGIIGLPNAGKSTLIAYLSSAKPKIADYPFTTLTPNLGVVQPAGGEPFVVADIPGMIAGAHQGAGLGLRFLRHVERTRFLVHLIDAAAIDSSDPLNGYRAINRELALYSRKLAAKAQIVVLNKLDLPGATERAASFSAALPEAQALKIAAATGRGVAGLVAQITERLRRIDE
jgi:GTP-binding protein